MSVTSQVPEFVNPFPGLRSYEYSEYPLFFGREGQSLEILRRLGNRRFVSVIGISGSGKSSLIRAGLLPYLDNAYLRQAGSRWRKAIFRPGSTPIANLAAALTGILTDPEHPMPDGFLDSTLHSSGLGLIKAVQYAHLPPQENVLIIVDQMEELFRFAKRAEDSRSFDQEDEASAFVKLLLEAVSQTEIPIYVVITMRSDFIGDCARFRDLPEAVNDGLYLIPRMIRDQRRQAIVGPIEAVGRQIAPRLVNRLLNDVGDSPDQLPLLQHALMRTFDRWVSDHAANEPVDLRHYEAIGGLTEALSRHADEAYSELPDQAHREIARRMFQSLTEKGPDGREVRRPSPVSEIMARTAAPFPQVARTIDTFRRAGRSFLMPPPDVRLDANTIIDISHESLIGGWDQLRKWVDDEAQSAAVYRRLADTAALYDDNQAGLYRDPDLQIALTWREREHPNEQWARRYHSGFASAMSFLDKSRQARDAQLLEVENARRRELARSRTFVAAVAVFGLAAILFAIYAFSQRSVARLKEKEATVSADKANRAKEDATVAEAQAVEAKGIADEALVRQNETNAKLKVALDNANAATKQAELARDEFRQEAINTSNTLLEDQINLDDLADTVIADETPRAAVSAHRRKGIAYSNIGDQVTAAREETKVLDAEPDNLAALSSRGYEYLLLGRIDDSIRDDEKYLQVNPRNAIVRQNLAIAKTIKGQYDEAIAEVKKSIELADPSDSGMYESELAPDIHATTGRLVLSVGADDYLLALRYYLAALQATKGDTAFIDSLKQADLAAKKLGLRPEASLYSTLNWVWLQFRESPKDYAALAIAGAIWDRLGKHDRSFQGCPRLAYQHFLSDHKTEKDPRYNGVAHWVDQQLAQQPAGASCGVIHKEDPHEPVIAAKILQNHMGNEGNVIQGGRVDKRLSDAIDLARQNPAAVGLLIDLLRRRAEFRYSTRDYVGARADAEEILKLHPAGVAVAYYYLGLIESDHAKKEDYFRKTVETAPTDSFYLWKFIDFLVPDETTPVSDEKLKEALALALRYSRTVSSPANAFRRLALIQLRLKQYRQALVSIQQAIDMDPRQLNYYGLRYDIERSLGLPESICQRHRAEGYRRAGDFTRSGPPGDSLALYLRGLRILVDALPSPKDSAGHPAKIACDASLECDPGIDPDYKFEIETSVRNISDYLRRNYSADFAQSFWTSAANTPPMAPIKDRLSAESSRIAAGGSR